MGSKGLFSNKRPPQRRCKYLGSQPPTRGYHRHRRRRHKSNKPKSHRGERCQQVRARRALCAHCRNDMCFHVHQFSAAARRFVTLPACASLFSSSPTGLGALPLNELQHRYSVALGGKLPSGRFASNKAWLAKQIQIAEISGSSGDDVLASPLKLRADPKRRPAEGMAMGTASESPKKKRKTDPESDASMDLARQLQVRGSCSNPSTEH
eukprot:SAG11_NODE_4548_length_1856_cov_0.774616_2_plen_209_part_00